MELDTNDLTEGWALAFDRKYHYFKADDTRSICMKIGFNTNTDREQGRDEHKENCKGCRRELYKIKREKSYHFVRHIEKHLETMPEVKDKRAHCKICNKNIDQIYEESVIE